MENLGTAVFASSIVILVLFAVMGVIAAILNARKTNKQKAYFADLHTNIKPGKRVMFAGGLFGTVTKVGDDVVEVRVKDGTLMDVSRYAIQEVVS